jgi:hypothetical protein
VTRWVLYGVALFVPLGCFFVTYFIVRKFKRERDEARKLVEGLMNKMKVPLDSEPKDIRNDAGKVATLSNQLRTEAAASDKKLREDAMVADLLNKPLSELSGAMSKPLAGYMKVNKVSVDWERMARLLGVEAQKAHSEAVYVISPDDFEQLRSDIDLHRTQNTMFEVHESDEGIMTMRLGCITYHIAKELFALVEEFWKPHETKVSNWHR